MFDLKKEPTMNLSTKTLVSSIGLASLLIVAPAKADNANIFVMAMRCDSVEIKNNGDKKISTRSLISGSSNAQNDKGRLFVNTDQFDVNGDQRMTLKAKYIDNASGAISVLQLNARVGSDVNAENLVCDSPTDTGNVGLIAIIDE